MLDTTVWINLLASEAIEDVLDALGLRCLAPEQVMTEVTRHPVTGAAFSPGDHVLRRLGPAVDVVPLEGSEASLFLDLVGAPGPDALGDGEAAAIAMAAVRRVDLVLDDRKARRICRERFPRLDVFWTVVLVRASCVVTALGTPRAADAFDEARRFGRRHVPRI